MMLPILISVSLTPGPYCFRADALPTNKMKATDSIVNCRMIRAIWLPLAVAEYSGESSRASHQRRYPTDDPGIAQSARRLHEVDHLAHDPMHRAILARDALQGRIEVHALAEIMRALPARLLIDEAALRR